MFSTKKKRKAVSPRADAGQVKRDRENARGRLASATSREIGAIPAVADLARRESCRLDLERFCTTYMPKIFDQPFSEDHRKAIRKLESAAISGGLFAFAMPRAGGKTSLCIAATIWAMGYGHLHWPCIIGATQDKAVKTLENVKSILQFNPSLLEDFPEICFPIRRLEGEARRAVGQLCQGKRTNMKWGTDELVFPTIAGSISSGSLVTVAGITGAIRGQNKSMPSGQIIRPDMAFIDDPQTTESATSLQQVIDRIGIISADILGLAGAGKKIAAVMPCTVIAPDDVADQMLNRELHPEWQGERSKLIYSFPSDTKMWETYQQMRLDSFRADGNGREATGFYGKNRAAMDDGAVVGWESRYDADELSAIQHAMNLKIGRGDAFDSEYQNSPRRITRQGALDPRVIAARLSGYPAGVAGFRCEKATAFIDCGQRLLWWMVCGWSMEFDCEILDYGTWPTQPTRFFSRAQPPKTLEQHYPAAGADGALYAGLCDLTNWLGGNRWPRSDGANIPLCRLLIDSGWSTEIVRGFVQRNAARFPLLPSKGVGIGPGQTAISDYHRKQGERIGDGWILGLPGPDRVRPIRFDANLWKTKLAGMLTRPMGAKCGVVLSGTNPNDHAMVANHFCGEYPETTSAKGVTKDIWKRRPDADIDLLDCLVGCGVAASFEGITPLAGFGSGVTPKKKIRLSQIDRKWD